MILDVYCGSFCSYHTKSSDHRFAHATVSPAFRYTLVSATIYQPIMDHVFYLDALNLRSIVLNSYAQSLWSSSALSARMHEYNIFSNDMFCVGHNIHLTCIIHRKCPVSFISARNKDTPFFSPKPGIRIENNILNDTRF